MLEKGVYIPKIKVSEDDVKVINPGFKKLYRFYDKESGYALGDVLALQGEVISEKQYTLINPYNEDKTTTLDNYTVRPLQIPIYYQGALVYETPTLEEERTYLKEQLNTLYPEVKRKLNPHGYYVDLSRELLTMKKELIKKARLEEAPHLTRNYHG